MDGPGLFATAPAYTPGMLTVTFLDADRSWTAPAVSTGLSAGGIARLEFVDAPGHVEDLERYRARGYAMKNNRIRIVTDHDADLIEVHPPSSGTVDPGGLTVERCPPGGGDGVRTSSGSSTPAELERNH